MSNNLSKSKYTKYCQCPKLLWLDKNKPEKAVIDQSVQRRFDEGTEAGNWAKRYFGDNFVDLAKCVKPDKTPDIPTMLKKTKALVAVGADNICEAAFSVDGCYCAVDILHKENGGYAIYEVKSSTKVSDVYIWDISYQKWVLEQAGINVTGTYIMHINNQYVRQGEIDIHKLFTVEDVSAQVAEYSPVVAGRVKLAKEILENAQEPERELGEYCNKPYECAYLNYCMKEVYGIPTPSVFDLYRIAFGKACEYFEQGIVTYADVINSGVKTTKAQDVQIKGEDIKDKSGINEFLNSLWSPLYFLDFETFQTCIPPYDGTKPYQQIPFQYSLHYVDGDFKSGHGKLHHKEFLAEEGTDPRRALAERLVEDIPDNACVLAYNKAFECTRIQELADTFPDLADKLIIIKDNIKDLLDVFQKGYVYEKAMGGSFSIKSVLPALFPNDPEKDYHNLEQVHNGSEATQAYLDLPSLSLEEREILRNNMLKYCEKDTKAMVWIWQWLVEELERRS